jgi:twinkle protein
VSKTKQDLIRDVSIQPLTKRAINQATAKKYGYGMAEYHGKPCQVAPYYDDKKNLVAQKVRFADKGFTITGDITRAGLFGQHLCRGSGKMIVVTEGELDAMSVAQSMGLSWPAVSIPNGAQSAVAAIKANLEFLEGHDKVVLMFDADEEGAKATEKCLPLFTPGKVSVADLSGFKDANSALQAGQMAMLRDAAWGAKPWRPDGLINMADARERVERPLTKGIPYPWPMLNDMLYGFRPGDLVCWTAGTGSGKSALVSELVYHLIMQDHKVGIIYLEEGLERAGKRIIGLHVNKPLHLPGYEISKPEFATAWSETLGRGNLIAYDHFGSLDEEVLTNRIRYLVKSEGVSTVVVDHISMIVSGMDLDADERRVLDHVVTTLKSLNMETNAATHIVSHLRRGEGDKGHENGKQVYLSQLRGTQAIGQLSDAVIGAERDQQSDDPVERNTLQLRVLKNRYSGITGPADKLYYNAETGRLNVSTGFETATKGGTDDF